LIEFGLQTKKSCTKLGRTHVTTDEAALPQNGAFTATFGKSSIQQKTQASAENKAQAIDNKTSAPTSINPQNKEILLGEMIRNEQGKQGKRTKFADQTLQQSTA
jgi:hypothetical protein